MKTESFSFNSKSYTLSSLTAGDRDDFRTFVQYLPYHTLYRNRKAFPPEVIDGKLDALFDKCTEKKVTVAEVQEVSESAEGASYMLYLSLRRNQPELTPEAVRELGDTMPPDIGEDVARKIIALNGWRNPKSASKKKEKSRAPRKTST